jgi:catalase
LTVSTSPDRRIKVSEDFRRQPGFLFRLMTPEKKQLLFENTGRAMGDAPGEIKIRQIGNCSKADPAYGEGAAKALGISMKEIPG